MIAVKKLFFLAFLIVSIFTELVGCQKLADDKIRVFNSGEYIDPNIIKQFEQETGVKVVYDEFYNNEDMYTKLIVSKYDVICTSDYMISRMIQEGMLYEIDFDYVPNYEQISNDYKNLEFDPDNQYSVPYAAGTLGILYDKNKVDTPINSWKSIFDPLYSGQILMIDSMRDAIGITLKYLGYSMNSENYNEITQAKDMLIAQKSIVLSYGCDEFKDKMLQGEAAIAVMYSIQVSAIDPYDKQNLVYVIPNEGSNIWVDSWVIMGNSLNKINAMKWIDFLCRPDIAKRNADFIQCATPNLGALELLERNNGTLYNLTESYCETFKYSANTTKLYNEIWTAVKVAKNK